MAVLGSMINWPQTAIDKATRMVVAADFHEPKHQTIFEAVLALHEMRRPVELVALNSLLTGNGTIFKVGGAGYLLELTRSATTPSGIDYYLGVLAEHAMRRAMLVAGQRITQCASTPNGMTGAEIGEFAGEQLAAAMRGSGEAAMDEGLGPDDLCADPPAHQWVIPGLLERGDRLMLTGEEGAGKSMLSRQIAVAAAAGLNPFTLAATGFRARVLVVDCENRLNLTLRRYKPLIDAAAKTGNDITAAKFRLYLEPKGIDLTKRAGQGWLIRRVEAFRPDLLVIGPQYRLQTAEPSDEQAAKRVAAVLDDVRHICGSALVMETHAPHRAGNSKQRDLRPIGSSLWLRWPDFGFGLTYSDDPNARMFRVMDLKPWRGSRDERRWPKTIRADRAVDGWAWVDDDQSVQGRPW